MTRRNDGLAGCVTGAGARLKCLVAAGALLFSAVLVADDVPWVWEDSAHPQDVTVSRSATVAYGFDSIAKTVAAAVTAMLDFDTWGTKTIRKDGINVDTRPRKFVIIVR